MDDFELIFTMLGERSTTEIHRQEESKGVPKLKHDAARGRQNRRSCQSRARKRNWPISSFQTKLSAKWKNKVVQNYEEFKKLK